MARILLIDDNVEMGPLVKTGLSSYEVEQVLSMSQAENVLSQSLFDLILIDVILPDGSGFDLCTRLANDSRFQSTPKIMLTAKDQVSEKVYGFNCGADDYLTKPFHTQELRARIDRHLKRSKDSAGGLFVHGGFEFNLEFQKAYVLNKDKKNNLNLTPTEFRLLLLLVKSEGHVLTRQHLEAQLWEAFGVNIEKRGVDTHIAHLRKKLGLLKKLIVSVYGQGYAFTPDKAA